MFVFVYYKNNLKTKQKSCREFFFFENKFPKNKTIVNQITQQQKSLSERESQKEKIVFSIVFCIVLTHK